MVVSTRIDGYVDQFKAANDEVIELVTRCTDEQWRRLTASEGWPVAVVAHHIAEVNGAFAMIVGRLAAGGTHSPTTSMDEVHRRNAEHAREYADVGKQEALDELRANGDAVLESLRSLQEDQLDRTAGVFGGNELSVARVVEWIIIGHTAEHLASIRNTLAD